jgi:hypothetical protein
MRRSNLDGTLAEFFAPSLSPVECRAAKTEDWILGMK